ncbi:MAG: hypothetical protein R2941_00600 [Desulfobacterales bacterium]
MGVNRPIIACTGRLQSVVHKIGFPGICPVKNLPVRCCQIFQRAVGFGGCISVFVLNLQIGGKSELGQVSFPEIAGFGFEKGHKWCCRWWYGLQAQPAHVNVLVRARILEIISSSFYLQILPGNWLWHEVVPVFGMGEVSVRFL